MRPHEALGDQVPASRWRPASDRPRPAELPEAESYYAAGAELRRVCAEGLVRVDGCRVLVGRGIATQAVRVERLEHEVVVYYCWKAVRRLSHRRRGVFVQLDRVEIKKASHDPETCPCKSEIRIELNRLLIAAFRLHVGFVVVIVVLD